MKITDIRLRHLTGTMEVDGPFFEDRLLQPTDIYEEFRNKDDRRGNRGSQVDDKTYKVEQTFVQIDTDEGVSGICAGGFGQAPIGTSGNSKTSSSVATLSPPSSSGTSCTAPPCMVDKANP